jgi:D-amino-acid dehydrogenase
MAMNALVIGGGAIGATVAYELARTGRSVTLLEREAEVGLGCSAGTAGLFAPSHAGTLATPTALREGIVWMTKPESPFFIRPRPQIVPWLLRFAKAALDRGQVTASTELLRRMSRDGLRSHIELADQVQTGLQRRGVLYTYESEAGFAHAQELMPTVSQMELTVRALEPTAARELEPAVGDGIVGAVYCEEEAHLDSLEYVRAIARAAADAGAEIRTRAEVLDLEVSDGRIVGADTTAGRFEAETVVLAAGVWSRAIGRRLGLSIPLEGAKGYHIEWKGTQGDPRIPIYMHEARVIATPYGDRLRLAGTLELAGLDGSIDAGRVKTLEKAARRNLRVDGPREVTSVWRGFRPTPPDGMPLLGRPRKYRNLVVATGHAMTGVALAPVTAKVVRELIDGEQPSYDLTLLDPDRF